MDTYVDAIETRAADWGWARAQTRRRLQEIGWLELLPAVRDELPAAALAEDLRRHTRCEICGHPLHPTVADVGLALADGQRLVRNLPHTAACSCGYARPLIPLVWTAVLTAYFRRNPEAAEVDAAAPAVLEAVRA